MNKKNINIDLNSNNLKSKPKKSKPSLLNLFYIVITIVLSSYVIGVSINSLIKGPVLDKEELIEVLAQDNSIKYDNIEYKITSDNIETIKAISRRTERRESDRVECKMTFNFDNVKISSDVEILLTYNKEDKKWLLTKVRPTSDMRLEPKIDLESNIKRLLKTSNSKNISSSINFETATIESISDISTQYKGINNENVTAKLTLSNGSTKSNYLINFDASFSLAEDNWIISSSSIESEIIEE